MDINCLLLVTFLGGMLLPSKRITVRMTRMRMTSYYKLTSLNFLKVLFQLYCVLLCEDLRFKTGIMLFFEISIFALDVFVSKNRPKGHGI